MKVLLVHNNHIPVFAYGGTERVIWDLAKALVEMGHEVTFLVKKGSHCDFAKTLEIDEHETLMAQVARLDFDIAHFQFHIDEEPDFPYVMTEHGNTKHPKALPLNTVFVSQDHARRYGSECFVYNGLDWQAYGSPDLQQARGPFHFLGHGAWRVKNLKGAIKVALAAKAELSVLGGDRFNFRRGVRLTFSPRIHFHGMVGGEEKLRLLQASQGLIFPVRWHEPFGLAVIESLYMGCPVFATPYGALPELVSPDCGVLAPTDQALVNALHQPLPDREACHLRAKTRFNHRQMGQGYVALYQQVLSGHRLNAQQPLLPGNGHALMDWSM
jgi:glycosyltransferase involved in cell wall biosynthesis